MLGALLGLVTFLVSVIGHTVFFQAKEVSLPALFPFHL